MHTVKDFIWEPGMAANEMVTRLGSVGFQSVELRKAREIILKMKRSGAKIFLTFTSNMVTSGLRGFFAQLIKLGMVDVIVTTVGGIEEDIMKATGEQFLIGDYHADDFELHERGVNRVGNLFIENKSYGNFEDYIQRMLRKLYEKQQRWTPSELFAEIGSTLEDEQSILYQASKHKVPIFCPAITDGALGFHLFMFQQTRSDFIVDVVQDFKNILFAATQDDIKGVICLGGGISKHHAILACLLNGGAEYALYMTTARYHSGSMSGATTQEAKSWGKIKDDSDASTVIGDVSITFPLAMISALEQLKTEGLLNDA